MVDRVAEVWGTRTPYGAGGRWPVRVDQVLAEGVVEADVDRWVQSACVLCSNGCGCDIAVSGGRMVGVRGRAVDTVNHGRLGPKGLYGSWEGMAGRDRLTRPLVREGGRLVETDWDTAMGRVVERSGALLAEHGPLSHGFYTSGQLFLEEYYALGVIGKAGIGTSHMDGNTRLCTATAATAMKESFGCDGQPGSYSDIDECDAIVLYGHNMPETPVSPRTPSASTSCARSSSRGPRRRWPRCAGSTPGTYGGRRKSSAPRSGSCPPCCRARSDLDIFLDYAQRMDFRDRDGAPLIPWSTPEEVFRAWQECSRGRLCDYIGLSYDRLRGGSGIPWPCDDEHPDGTLRLYADGVFPTDPDVCEDYGHDLVTGADVEPEAYRALAPGGRAFLKAVPYLPPHEEPDDDFPFRYSTGRTAYHFHTRTKTRRAWQLDRAAPDAWVELSVADAERLGVAEGDIVRVTSRRGEIVVPARVAGGRDGTVFAPFHYGDADGGGRAANELTMTEWDPVSKQPVFKVAAVRVERVRAGDGPAPAPTTTASRPAGPARVPATSGGPAADAAETLEETLEETP